jgi:catechol 2,3-dioxygenase-like lactoylglutathione lyase family enzyme
MSNTNRFKALVFSAVFAALPAFGQLADFNSSGVRMGHVHLVVRDPDAHKHFYTLLGGVPVKNGSLDLIQFPGGMVMLRKGESSGGTVGSRVNHWGFWVKNIAYTLDKIQGLGYPIERRNPMQAFVLTPDDVRIELLEDSTLTVPIRLHHVHLEAPDPAAVQAWYAKIFGAVPGKRERFDNATLPGIELSITKTDTPEVPTKGRSFDHVGFDVKAIDEFSKKVEAEGLKFDAPIRQVPGAKTRVAFFTDPWGLYIEITENLAPGS